jgi:hypothetical protein
LRGTDGFGQALQRLVDLPKLGLQRGKLQHGMLCAVCRLDCMCAGISYPTPSSSPELGRAPGPSAATADAAAPSAATTGAGSGGGSEGSVAVSGAIQYSE